MRWVALGLIASTALLACGGGGGDSTAEPPPPAPAPPAPPPAANACVAPGQPGFGISVAATRVFPNLTFSSPVLLTQPPGDTSKWYVVEQGGVVKSFDNSNGVSSTSTFIDISGRVVNSGEAGLLGMAFDPSYASNGRVYLSYTASPQVPGSVLESRISRFTRSGSALDAGSESILLTIPQPFTNHNGGHVAFGPDGLLYAGFGDGGSSGDPNGNAQNRSTLLGKMLRIDVSSGGNYTIPAENPFAGAGSARCQGGSTSSGSMCGEILAYGFRNPWRWSFDRASTTPDLWVGDVGQNAWEEVDRVVAGGNYGWNYREGAHCYEPATNCPTSGNGVPLIEPVGEYSHTLGNSITGGFVYRGSAIPALVGRYVFGDFGSGRVFALIPDADGTLQRREILATGGLISSFTEDSDGELYFVNYSGTLHKLVPGAEQPNPIKPLLSQTGCVSSSDPQQPASALIPYTPIAQFWSDGASKTRWMSLPANTRITVEADGDWTFPPGTVLMKNFTLNGVLIETRLFMRHTDTGNWGGYSYRWNAAHTDAELVSGGLTETIGSQDWLFPSEAQCLQCHTSGAGSSLGLETRQLNTGTQLATLQEKGLFANPPAAEPPYPDPTDATQPVKDRARAYLHTNCAQCHRPGGGTPVTLDLRFATAIGATQTCEVAPASGNLGVSGAQIIAPGASSKSVLYLRMNRRGAEQMPPLASHVVDTQGSALIQQWIDGMGAGCQ